MHLKWDCFLRGLQVAVVGGRCPGRLAKGRRVVVPVVWIADAVVVVRVAERILHRIVATSYLDDQVEAREAARTQAAALQIEAGPVERLCEQGEMDCL